MLRNLLIAVLILLGLMLVGYLLAMLPAGPEQDGLSSTISKTSTNQDRSWLGDMYHAWKVTRPQDDGIRRVKTIYPDSDTSECVGVTKTSDQMISTRFAGHILQYPCTANHDSRSTVHYNQANEVTYQNHALYLRVLIRPDRESIWQNTSTDYGSGRDVLRVKFSSDGKRLSHEPISSWIAGATKIADFESINLSVYLNGNDIKGFIPSQMNDQEGYPNIGCTGSTVERALDIFDPIRPPFTRAHCDASWSLNKFIRIRIQMPNSADVRNFAWIYEKLDQGLRNTIIKEPNGITSSNQED